MKKFISMVMAASMVASLVPATAFAAKADEITGTARVVDAWDQNRDFNGTVEGPLTPEAQVKINSVDYLRTDGAAPKARFKVVLDNAKFKADLSEADIKWTSGSAGNSPTVGTPVYSYTEQKEAALKEMLGAAYDGWGANPTKPVAGDGYIYVTDANMAAWKDTKDTSVQATQTAVTGTWLKDTASVSAPVKAEASEAQANADAALDAWLTAKGKSSTSADYDFVGAVDGSDSKARWEGITSTADPKVVSMKEVIAWAKGTPASFTEGSAFAGSSKTITTTGDFTNGSATVDAADITAVKKDVTLSLTTGSVDIDLNGLTIAATDTNAQVLAKIQGAIDTAVNAHNTTGAAGAANYYKVTEAAVAATNATTLTISFNETLMTYGAATPAKPAIIATLNADGTGFKGTAGSGADDKATWVNTAYTTLSSYLTAQTAKIYKEHNNPTGVVPPSGVYRDIKVSIEELRDDEVTILVEGYLEKDDIISVDLRSTLKTASKTASFSIESDDIKLSNDGADIVYVQVAQEGLVLSVRKLVDVAEEEVVTLDDRGLVIKTNVGEFKTGDIVLKLSKGFEFADSYKFIEDKNGGNDWRVVAKNNGETVGTVKVVAGDDDDELVVKVDKDFAYDEIVIYGIDIEATSAKSGSTATIRATSKGFTAAAAVEVAKVVDYKVILERDEDEDLPVIYSGVDTDNYGITDDSDHWSVEITAKETFPGAWSFRKGFNFEITEGVYVADIDVVEVDGFLKSKTDAITTATPVTAEEVGEAFFNAYQNGSHVNFEFDKRVFDDVDAKLNEDKATMTFKLQLVADPGFEGDAVVKLTGELVDEQELTVAKFVKPYEVKAEQNDMIIDYRYTEVPTAITITEAEAGLWDADKATFNFSIEKENLMSFEDDPTFEVDSKSDLELKNAKVKDGQITFTVKSESDEAATVTIKDIQLFMNRSIPAGPYDLSIRSSLADAYDREVLFAPDGDKIYTSKVDADAFRGAVDKDQYPKDNASRPANEKEDCFVGDVADYSDTVKEAFVNVVTAGRDQDDASFTTKVVVPVGENYIVAGEKQIELDTPAYINAAGYTMLPIRAVAVALGINSNNVLWDQPTKTVTILYGQRIITMTQGQKVVYVNGSAIPASAAVENTNSRTFLPMRDLATALGVTDITWDQATRTATLNGNQK